MPATILSTAILIWTRTVLSESDSASAISRDDSPSCRLSRNTVRQRSGKSFMRRRTSSSTSASINRLSGASSLWGGDFGRSARWESPRTRGSGGAYGTPSDTGSPRCARRRRGRRRCFRSSAARRGTSRRRRRRCSRPRRRPPCCAENSRRTGKRSGNRDHRKPGKRNRRSRLRKQANSQVLFSSPRPGMFRLSQDKIRKLFQNRNIRFR